MKSWYLCQSTSIEIDKLFKYCYIGWEVHTVVDGSGWVDHAISSLTQWGHSNKRSSCCYYLLHYSMRPTRGTKFKVKKNKQKLVLLYEP